MPPPADGAASCTYPELVSSLCQGGGGWSAPHSATRLTCSAACLSWHCLLRPCTLQVYAVLPLLLLATLLNAAYLALAPRPQPSVSRGVVAPLYHLLTLCLVVFYLAAFVLSAVFACKVAAANWALLALCAMLVCGVGFKTRLLVQSVAAFAVQGATTALLLLLCVLQAFVFAGTADSELESVLLLVSVLALALLVCALLTILIVNGLAYPAYVRAQRLHQATLRPPLGTAEEGVGPLGYLTIAWAGGLLRRGWAGQLHTVEDTFTLPPSVDITAAADLFEHNMLRHKQQCDASRSAHHTRLCDSESEDESEETTEDKHDDVEALVQVVHPKKGPPPPINLSTMRVYFRTYGLEMIPMFFFRISSDACNLSNPLLLNAFISFLSSDSQPVQRGAILGLSMIAVTGCGILLEQMYFYQSWKIVFKSRGAVMIGVYRKMMQVNQCHLARFSTGEIVNLMSRDAFNVSLIPLYIHQFFAMPLNLVAVLVLLYCQVGWAFAPGVALCVLCVPLNQLLTGKMFALEKQYLKWKDQRVKTVTEVLNGMRTVKLAALEAFFTHVIGEKRAGELRNIRRLKYLDALCVYLWAALPVLLSLVIFLSYTMMGHQLTAATVFTVLCYVNLLVMPLNAFPWVMNSLIEAYVSFGRLDNFYDLRMFHLGAFYLQHPASSAGSTPRGDCSEEEHDGGARPSGEKEDPVLTMRDCTFSYGRKVNPEDLKVHSALADVCFKMLCVSKMKEEPEPEAVNKSFQKLRHLSLSVPRGSLVGVFGKVGAGKTSFLSAVIGEMNRVEGTIQTPELATGFGYVPQEAWLHTGTIRDNILLGSEFDQPRYEQVLLACALNQDLKALPRHDLTQVGERGITLSGGQKSRVTLARALYKDFNVYLLDDPISAVDAHVAAHLYKYAIRGLLRSKTVVLCTHHTHYLNECDLVLSLEGGRIENIGTPAEVLAKIGQIKDHDKEDVHINSEVITLDTRKPADSGLVAAAADPEDVDEEDQRVGDIDTKIYLVYFRAGSVFLGLLFLACILAMQTSKNGADLWLGLWTKHIDQTNQPSGNSSSHTYRSSSATAGLSYFHINFVQFSPTDSELDTPHTSLPHLLATSGTASVLDQCKFYLIVYGCIALANSFFSLARAFVFAFANIRASVVIHHTLLQNVLKFKNSVFSHTPVGRIVNRFSSDIGVVDDDLPFVLNVLFSQLFTAMGLLTVICIAVPYILPFVLLVLFVLYWLQAYYRCSSRELRRIATVNMSPVYNHFNESIYGASVIKAMRVTHMFQRENELRINRANRARFNERSVQRWFAMRLQLFSMSILVAVVAFGLLQKRYFPGLVDAALFGLCISYCLSIRSCITVLLATFAENEKNIISVERIHDYGHHAKFEPLHGLDPPPGWPSRGEIEFSNVALRYGEDEKKPCALKNLSFTIGAGCKVGVCGRTGAGKSSILGSLFRLEPICEGRISIDGVDISSVKVRELRSRMSIIPQDPFLFSGSVRANLDQSEQKHSDEVLWRALARAHCADAVAALGGLDAEVGEKGQYFSSGQKQLVCLARALLLDTRILCLDEATANVDEATDNMIQQTIRHQFKHKTVITIAHRINTIMHCDHVIVLDAGHVAESGSPDRLLNSPDSMFSRLVQQAGLSTTCQ